MRKILALTAASFLLAACEKNTAAPASSAIREGLPGTRPDGHAGHSAGAKAGKRVRKVAKLAKSTKAAKATKADARDARDEEFTGSTPIILNQSPPSSD